MDITEKIKQESEKLIETLKKIPYTSHHSHNLNEFFAVAIENFIERPKEFKEYNHILYNNLSKILNFDLLEISPYTT